AIARPIPFDAPVTSALFPSSEAKVTIRPKASLATPTIRGSADSFGASAQEHVVQLVERGEAVHRHSLDAAVDALDETGEHVAGTDLDERAHALAHELARSLREADRSSCSSRATRRGSSDTASRRLRPRGRGWRPSSRDAVQLPRPSRCRARARARWLPRRTSRRTPRLLRTRRRSGR